MITYNHRQPFPLGAIRPEGFLQEQLYRAKAGISGRLWELAPEVIESLFSGAVKNQESPHGEYAAEYLTGYIKTAFLLQDEEMILQATAWVEKILSRANADGSLDIHSCNAPSDLGSHTPTLGASPDDPADDYALVCARISLALLAFYEATGRGDVLTALERALLWFCDAWQGERKTVRTGVSLIAPMILLYRKTGNAKLLRFAEEYLSFLRSHDVLGHAYTHLLYDDFQYNSMKTTMLGSLLPLPALVYSANGKEELLRASEKGLSQIWEHATHLTGAPVSMAEYLGPVGGNTEGEYCSFALFGEAYAMLAEVTGDAIYGERHEEMFYNAAEGARKKDERAIASLSSPNQHYASHLSSPTMDSRQMYAPDAAPLCCSASAVTVLPNFIQNTWLHTEDTLYVMMYAPTSLASDRFALREETEYPFRNHARFILACDESFTLALRLPSWAEGYTLLLNDLPTATESKNGFILLSHSFRKGDRVDIRFHTSVRVMRVDDSDYTRKFPLAVRYGALLYAYHIPERWEIHKSKEARPLPAGWERYTVWATFDPASGADMYEQRGRKRDMISWNVALSETLTQEDFTVEEREGTGYPWEEPPVCLHTRAYKAIYHCPPYPHKTFEPYGERLYVTHELPLTLVPFGCTNLRVTYFPKADLSTLKK